MEDVIKKAITLILFGLCWTYLMPYLRKKKAELVKKIEASIERRGFLKQYKVFYKVIKTFLYILLAIMILAPVLFFIVIIFNSR